jgi:3-isopropylmalate/(R)-2-methylmalate dehydratase small subunit
MGRQTMEALTTLIGPAAPMLVPDINTDAIAPMYTPATAGQPRAFAMSPEELARRLFANWRYDSQDRERPDFVLNRAPFRHAKFIIGDINFGCGSSRDTAPKMLGAFGIRCVIAPSFGGIFYDNCFKIGILPMVLGNDAVHSLAQEAIDGKDFSLDVTAQTLVSPAGNMWRFDLPSFRREQLLTGADDIALTLRRNNEIAAYQERERAARPWTFLPPRRIG